MWFGRAKMLNTEEHVGACQICSACAVTREDLIRSEDSDLELNTRKARSLESQSVAINFFSTHFLLALFSMLFLNVPKGCVQYILIKFDPSLESILQNSFVAIGFSASQMIVESCFYVLRCCNKRRRPMPDAHNSYNKYCKRESKGSGDWHRNVRESEG